MNLREWLDEKRGRGLQLAGGLLVSPPMVSDYASGKKQIPAERCPTIERLTERAVTCEELRPDVEWHVLRTADAVPIRNGGVDAAGGSTVVVLASPPAANDSAPDVPAPERA